MILVTGATGFVGKNLIKILTENSYNVSILEREYNYNNLKCFIGDLNNKEILDNATKNVNVIVHLAGTSKGNVFKVNSEGTKNLVDAAVKNKVKKFIFISSYDIITKTKYGLSKLKAEGYIKKSGINYIIFRPTVIYGPENKKDINKLIYLIKKSRIIPIPGNGRYKFQPLFVEDLVNLILQSIKSKKNNKEYFVAGPEVLSFNQIVDEISKIFSKKCYKIYIPKFIIYFLNKNLLEDKFCDISEIKKDFKFNPISFEKGLKQTIINNQ